MAYTYPGVYIEEVPSVFRPIESAGTSTAVFIGTTNNGAAGEPRLIFKWSDYEDQFGGIQNLNDKADAMGLAVYTFFLNGGGAAYIAHVNEGAPAVSTKTTYGYDKVFAFLAKISDINIICLPGKAWGKVSPADNKIISAAIAHAEKMKNRMVIVDLDPETVLTQEADVKGLNPPSSKFSVTYYPWLKVANSFYGLQEEEKDGDGKGVDNGGGKDGSGKDGGGKKDAVPSPPPTFSIAPSSFVAGMWAKIDRGRGVWKAPAGVETALSGVAGLVDSVDDERQGILNPLGINCIRKIPGAGPVIWGSRTLATMAKPEWCYVPVRRTACMIEESIYNNIQWAVFEPNDHRLWSSLRVNIDSFMNGLWRAGAFQGAKASDAYFVSCNLGDTMGQDNIDKGEVVVRVGFAPLKPAEFVIIRIQQKVAQQ